MQKKLLERERHFWDIVFWLTSMNKMLHRSIAQIIRNQSIEPLMLRHKIPNWSCHVAHIYSCGRGYGLGIGLGWVRLSLLKYHIITINNFKSPADSTAITSTTKQNIRNAKDGAMTGQPIYVHTYSLVSVTVQPHGTESQQLSASQHTLIRRGSGALQKSLTQNTIERATTQYETEQSLKNTLL